MRKLIVDLDDVLCQHGFIKMVNEFLGTSYQESDAGSYFINDLIPKNRMTEWVEFFINRNVYEYVEVVKDAQRVMEKLNKKYELYVASAFVFRDAPETSGKTLNDKYNFLSKEFPFLDPHQFVFVSNKELLEADIRIDDSTKKLTGPGQIKILFTAYHNKNLTKKDLEEQGIVRADTWKEIENMLL